MKNLHSICVICSHVSFVQAGEQQGQESLPIISKLIVYGLPHKFWVSRYVETTCAVDGCAIISSCILDIKRPTEQALVRCLKLGINGTCCCCRHAPKGLLPDFLSAL